jgi:hypothetical protein
MGNLQASSSSSSSSRAVAVAAVAGNLHNESFRRRAVDNGYFTDTSTLPMVLATRALAEMTTYTGTVDAGFGMAGIIVFDVVMVSISMAISAWPATSALLGHVHRASPSTSIRHVKSEQMISQNGIVAQTVFNRPSPSHFRPRQAIK